MINGIPNYKNNCIEENTLLEIKGIQSKHNQVSVVYKETRIKNCRLFISRLVGFVHIAPVISMTKILRPNDLVMTIEELDVLNEVHMEQSGKIEAVYVEENQFVMYGTPLLLIRCLDSS
ncbi:biotin/lipoyl-binding protein [Lactococcus allomyrinae]|uniref:biotin/lipoyl-binding protein n=1 Tax=Lactococcus allomyrinae TaxID=2419773 RepID=UPI0019695D97|nr:biotin/lipoyl-binding protein [Lactococcus allomyrinae]